MKIVFKEDAGAEDKYRITNKTQVQVIIQEEKNIVYGNIKFFSTM